MWIIETTLRIGVDTPGGCAAPFARWRALTLLAFVVVRFGLAALRAGASAACVAGGPAGSAASARFENWSIGACLSRGRH